jgi:hypothetical protein
VNGKFIIESKGVANNAKLKTSIIAMYAIQPLGSFEIWLIMQK